MFLRPATAVFLSGGLCRRAVRTASVRPMAPRVLICLDLNGTLLDRLTDGDRIKRSRTNPKCPPIPDLVINGKKIYFRPYLDLFLEGLFRSFAVATWTSAMPKNADPMVTHLFPKKLRGKLQFNWTREKCEIMGSAREHQSIKDLAKMWADEEASSAGRWNERNTLIIDDSVGKGARNPFNAIHLVPFTVTEPDHLDCDTDSTLLSVINYLSHLVEWLEQDPDRDVRDFVRDNPLYVLEAFEAGMDSDGTETAQLEVAERYRATMEQIRDADAMRPRHRRDTEGFTRHWLQTQGARALEVDGDATQQWDKSHKDADLKKYKPSATVVGSSEEPAAERDQTDGPDGARPHRERKKKGRSRPGDLEARRHFSSGAPMAPWWQPAQQWDPRYEDQRWDEWDGYHFADGAGYFFGGRDDHSAWEHSLEPGSITYYPAAGSPRRIGEGHHGGPTWSRQEENYYSRGQMDWDRSRDGWGRRSVSNRAREKSPRYLHR